MQMTTIDAIRIPGDASACIRTAAAELARWIEMLGGTRPTTRAHSDSGRVTAWLDNGIDLKPEHFRIEVNDGAVLRIKMVAAFCMGCRNASTAPAVTRPTVDRWTAFSDACAADVGNAFEQGLVSAFRKYPGL